MKVPEIVSRINDLKHKHGVKIYAHYYMPEWLQKAEALGGIADVTGDSLALSLEASRSDARKIIFCGVRFMAETVKILKPDIQVYMPDPSAGCSLAASINAEKLAAFKKDHPGIPVVGYINTYAETKTMMDICCTSRNAIPIIESLESDRILFVPDKHMGANLNRQLKLRGKQQLILWDGSCEVHEAFTFEKLQGNAKEVPLLVHWEVPESATVVMDEERHGVVGSTGDILEYVGKSEAETFYLASECDLATTIRYRFPNKNIVTPCIECHYMKQNDLEKVLKLLEKIEEEEDVSSFEITLNDDIIQKASLPLIKMIQLS